MTELKNTPQRQSSDPMDSDSKTGDIRPNAKRQPTGRWRWYLFAVLPVVLLTLVVVGAGPGGGCTLEGIIPEPETGVFFDLGPFLADAARTVDARACVRERYSGLMFALSKPSSSCASFTVYSDSPLDREARWRYDELDPWSDGELDSSDPRQVFIEEPPLTWEQPIAVRLTIRDQAGNSIFDSSAVVQPYTVSYEPSCYGVIDVARVVATRPGRLAPYKVWEPNS